MPVNSAAFLILTVVCLVTAADLMVNATPAAFPVPAAPFYEAKSERDLPDHLKNGRFKLGETSKEVRLQNGWWADFNVLVNASGVLKFALVSNENDCEYTISFNQQQPSQIKIHPVSQVPKDTQFVEGTDFQGFKHHINGSGSRFDFVVDGTQVGVTFSELTTASRVPEAENSEESSDETEPQSVLPKQQKTIDITAWKAWDYGYGAQQRISVHAASSKPSCQATLIFPSSTAFVFPEDEMPVHLRPTTTTVRVPTNQRRAGSAGPNAAAQHNAAIVMLALFLGIVLLL